MSPQQLGRREEEERSRGESGSESELLRLVERAGETGDELESESGLESVILSSVLSSPLHCFPHSPHSANYPSRVEEQPLAKS